MSKTKPPAFQFYASDFLGAMSVQVMELDERGAYITLLAQAWLENGLPDDRATLAKLLGLKANSAKFARIAEAVLPQFELVDGRLKNPRQERIRAEQGAYRDQQRALANRRWEKTSRQLAVPSHTPSQMPAYMPPHTRGQSPSPPPSTPNPLNPPRRTVAAVALDGPPAQPQTIHGVMASLSAELRPIASRNAIDDVGNRAD